MLGIRGHGQAATTIAPPRTTIHTVRHRRVSKKADVASAAMNTAKIFPSPKMVWRMGMINPESIQAATSKSPQKPRIAEEIAREGTPKRKVHASIPVFETPAPTPDLDDGTELLLAAELEEAYRRQEAESYSAAVSEEVSAPFFDFNRSLPLRGRPEMRFHDKWRESHDEEDDENDEFIIGIVDGDEEEESEDAQEEKKSYDEPTSVADFAHKPEALAAVPGMPECIQERKNLKKELEELEGRLVHIGETFDPQRSSPVEVSQITEQLKSLDTDGVFDRVAATNKDTESVRYIQGLVKTASTASGIFVPEVTDEDALERAANTSPEMAKAVGLYNRLRSQVNASETNLVEQYQSMKNVLIEQVRAHASPAERALLDALARLNEAEEKIKSLTLDLEIAHKQHKTTSDAWSDVQRNHKAEIEDLTERMDQLSVQHTMLEHTFNAERQKWSDEKDELTAQIHRSEKMIMDYQVGRHPDDMNVNEEYSDGSRALAAALQGKIDGQNARIRELESTVKMLEGHKVKLVEAVSKVKAELQAEKLDQVIAATDRTDEVASLQTEVSKLQSVIESQTSKWEVERKRIKSTHDEHTLNLKNEFERQIKDLQERQIDESVIQEARETGEHKAKLGRQQVDEQMRAIREEYEKREASLQAMSGKWLARAEAMYKRQLSDIMDALREKFGAANINLPTVAEAVHNPAAIPTAIAKADEVDEEVKTLKPSRVSEALLHEQAQVSWGKMRRFVGEEADPKLLDVAHQAAQPASAAVTQQTALPASVAKAVIREDDSEIEHVDVLASTWHELSDFEARVQLKHGPIDWNRLKPPLDDKDRDEYWAYLGKSARPSTPEDGSVPTTDWMLVPRMIARAYRVGLPPGVTMRPVVSIKQPDSQPRIHDRGIGGEFAPLRRGIPVTAQLHAYPADISERAADPHRRLSLSNQNRRRCSVDLLPSRRSGHLIDSPKIWGDISQLPVTKEKMISSQSDDEGGVEEAVVLMRSSSSSAIDLARRE